MYEMNNEQQRAVDFHHGALLLLAGPGSGKTFVLTHRIKALIDRGADPGSILVITFTRAAAAEMRERFYRLCGDDRPPVTFGTFHSVFYTVLKSHIAFRSVVPITEKEKLNMLKRASEISGVEYDASDHTDVMRTLGLISSCKNKGNDPALFHQDRYCREDFIKLFDAYNRLLLDFNRIDFDDMINLCLEKLQTDAEFLQKWQNRFSCIMVDEFQDVSENQFRLVKLLAAPEYDVFAVGDDDQSIYGFRGADVRIMKKFLEEIPGAVRQDLSVNYRSSRDIVDAALSVIEDNHDRFTKKITANRDVQNPVVIKKCSTVKDQYDSLVNEILRQHEEGLMYEEMAILTRTNRQGREYASLLDSNNIPNSFSFGDIPFGSGYIRDICAYLELASGCTDRSLFLRIMNKPVRFIKRAALPYEKVKRESLLEYYRGDPDMIYRVEKLYDHLKRIRNMKPRLAVKYICSVVGYDCYVKDNANADTYIEYTDERDAFLEFIKDLGSYTDVKEALELLRRKALETSSKDAVRPGVRIMTFHGSKGLEFSSVFIPDVNEGHMPPRSAHEPAAVEEERRMFYVAVTRAKDYLMILYRTDRDRNPSRFIRKLIRVK